MSLSDNTQSFSEDQTLQKFGYQQEFKRELKRFASFAIGFSFIWISPEFKRAIGHMDLAACHHWSIIRLAGLCRAGITYTAGRLLISMDVTTGEP